MKETPSYNKYNKIRSKQKTAYFGKRLHSNISDQKIVSPFLSAYKPYLEARLLLSKKKTPEI